MRGISASDLCYIPWRFSHISLWLSLWCGDTVPVSSQMMYDSAQALAILLIYGLPDASGTVGRLLMEGADLW